MPSTKASAAVPTPSTYTEETLVPPTSVRCEANVEGQLPAKVLTRQLADVVLVSTPRHVCGPRITQVAAHTERGRLHRGGEMFLVPKTVARAHKTEREHCHMG